MGNKQSSLTIENSNDAVKLPTARAKISICLHDIKQCLGSSRRANTKQASNPNKASSDNRNTTEVVSLPPPSIESLFEKFKVCLSHEFSDYDIFQSFIFMNIQNRNENRI